MYRRGVALAAAAATLLLGAAGCGSAGANPPQGGGAGGTVRLGVFPNLTHAPALVGLQEGIFQRDLGSGVTLEVQSFNAGPQAMTALAGGSIDASFVGPSPVINTFVKGGGVRIVSGTTSGGAALVVRGDESISGPSDLRGRTLATPQLGNTQDVALRHYLQQHGYQTDQRGGGDVKVVPTENGTTLQLFAQKQIDGAWVPEPYATQLLQSGGRLLVDEASQWPGGRFVTTNLAVSTAFLRDHPDLVHRLVEATADSVDAANADAPAAQAAANAKLAALTHRTLSTAVLAAAWPHLGFSVDPIASSLKTGFEHAQSLGLQPRGASIAGIYDLAALDGVLRARGMPAVDDAGLGAR